jgi:ABC-2 type transport system ATP-binding protein
MWELIRTLRASGVTIILTTHYIQEAEELADRIGVINGGELVLVEDKQTLMTKLGKKELSLELTERLETVPEALAPYRLELAASGTKLVYRFDADGERTQITRFLKALDEAGIAFRDLQTRQSSLEEIFVSLVHNKP